MTYYYLLLHHIYLHTGAASTLPAHTHEYKILVGMPTTAALAKEIHCAMLKGHKG